MKQLIEEIGKKMNTVRYYHKIFRILKTLAQVRDARLFSVVVITITLNIGAISSTST